MARVSAQNERATVKSFRGGEAAVAFSNDGTGSPSVMCSRSDDSEGDLASSPSSSTSPLVGEYNRFTR